MQFCAFVLSAGADTKFHILNRRQGAQQIMLLENKTDLLANFFECSRPRTPEFFTQDLYTAILCRPQSAHQGQHGCFTGTGGAGYDDDLTGLNFGRDIKQDLLAQLTLAEGVVQATDTDGSGIRRHNAPSKYIGRIEPAYLAHREKTGKCAHG